MEPRESTLIGGRYRVTKGEPLIVLVPMLHRDPKVFGPDVEAFRPERFDREREAELPAHAFKPFGTGQRACIGRPFAMQEALLVLSMILQRFDLAKADPSYQLKVKETLTLKPHRFRMRVRRRADRASSFAASGRVSGSAERAAATTSELLAAARQVERAALY